MSMTTTANMSNNNNNNNENNTTPIRYGMDRYLKGEVLGEGTFGVVVKAIDLCNSGNNNDNNNDNTNEVAVKKIRLQKLKEGVNMTALREIKILKVFL